MKVCPVIARFVMRVFRSNAMPKADCTTAEFHVTGRCYLGFICVYIPKVKHTKLQSLGSCTHVQAYCLHGTSGTPVILIHVLIYMYLHSTAVTYEFPI